MSLEWSSLDDDFQSVSIGSMGFLSVSRNSDGWSANAFGTRLKERFSTEAAAKSAAIHLGRKLNSEAHRILRDAKYEVTGK